MQEHEKEKVDLKDSDDIILSTAILEIGTGFMMMAGALFSFISAVIMDTDFKGRLVLVVIGLIVGLTGLSYFMEVLKVLRKK